MAAIFRDRLASLGQIDGRNVRIEFRLAEGHAERFPELARALVRDNASVIVASGDAAVRAARLASDKDHSDYCGGRRHSGWGADRQLGQVLGAIPRGREILATELDAKRLDIRRRIVVRGQRFGGSQ